MKKLKKEPPPVIEVLKSRSPLSESILKRGDYPDDMVKNSSIPSDHIIIYLWVRDSPHPVADPGGGS